ncbi:SDR family NAD(P)-dependent oxidoreductase [Parasedimentitalea psychrophila]|uniref:Glucose 1-dehydrogenase n=1 Tax=Parasedimentitalea psychrophila TaxID=2997337 RepID=A0A9Y2L094_9RHOB|nr:glucose 1-dehydrogenase [Parasedimentitalea psychrophila]WIY25793.1 glucose 1-dehydrogenase [Parasedimentitalea psychrophila]
MSRYDNKVALITGAGHGIGRSIAQKLAQDGAAVSVLDIDEEMGQQTVEMLQSDGHKAIFVRADITKYDEVEAAFAKTAETLGTIDLLVNNAAFSMAGDLKNMPLDAWHHEINVNLNGPYHCIRAVLSSMVESGGGAIINIASVNGVRYFGSPAYSAAKAAIISLTQCVASEYGSKGIRCNAILPGSVQTDAVAWQTRIDRDPNVFEKLARWYPVGRVGQPDDVAKAVSFLGSDEAEYISGVALPVDGGLLAGMNVMIDEFVLEG